MGNYINTFNGKECYNVKLPSDKSLSLHLNLRHINISEVENDYKGKYLFISLHFGCLTCLKDKRRVVIIDRDCKSKAQRGELIEVIYVDKAGVQGNGFIYWHEVMFEEDKYGNSKLHNENDIILRPCINVYNYYNEVKIECAREVEKIVRKRKNEGNYLSRILLKVAILVLVVVNIMAIVNNYRYIQLNDRLKYDRYKKEFFVYYWTEDGELNKRVVIEKKEDAPSKKLKHKKYKHWDIY